MSFERMRFETPDRSGLPPLNALRQMFDGKRIALPDIRRRAAAASISAATVRLFPFTTGRSAWSRLTSCWPTSRQQVESGAQHITFGDPDFFNGPTHGMRIS